MSTKSGKLRNHRRQCRYPLFPTHTFYPTDFGQVKKWTGNRRKYKGQFDSAFFWHDEWNGFLVSPELSQQLEARFYLETILARFCVLIRPGEALIRLS